MSDRALRAKLIRLAHANPELRAQILPLLKEASFVDGKPHCDMAKDCEKPVTHIDKDGYIYCEKHAAQRKSGGVPTRKLKPAEIKKLEQGQTVNKYAGCEKLPEGGMRDNCEEKVEEGKESASKKAAGHTTYSEYVRDWKKLKYPVTVKGEILTEERWTKLMKGEESASKKAGSNDVIEYVLPMDDMAKLYHKLEKQDEQSAKLLMEVYNVLRARLKLSDGESEAMSRVRGMTTRGQNWDVDLLRNNIFKAAHSLGMKLPSMMF